METIVGQVVVMARWRTHNKRARRKRERDAELLRKVDKLLVPALENLMQNAIRTAFADLANRMSQITAAWAKVGAEMSQGWPPLDSKYARRRRREEWPEEILEDILDAEYIE